MFGIIGWLYQNSVEINELKAIISIIILSDITFFFFLIVKKSNKLIKKL